MYHDNDPSDFDLMRLCIYYIPFCFKGYQKRYPARKDTCLYWRHGLADSQRNGLYCIDEKPVHGALGTVQWINGLL